MKKFVFTLLLVFVCHLGYAQGINGLFNEFGSEKNADCVKVSSFMMSLGKMFAGHDDFHEYKTHRILTSNFKVNIYYL